MIGSLFKMSIKDFTKTNGETQVNIDGFVNVIAVKCPCCSCDLVFTTDLETFDHIHVSNEPCVGQTKVKVIYFHL